MNTVFMMHVGIKMVITHHQIILEECLELLMIIHVELDMQMICGLKMQMLKQLCMLQKMLNSLVAITELDSLITQQNHPYNHTIMKW